MKETDRKIEPVVSSGGSGGRSRWRRRLLALALGCVVPFAALEALLLWVNFHHVPVQAPFLVWNAKQDQRLHDDVSLHLLDTDLLWSPRPGAPISPESSERIDDRGLRGFDAVAWNAPGALGMATLGDSSTFGWGVDWEQSWSAQAAKSLGGLLERPVATLGAGVIGYTVVQGRRRYGRDVAPLSPAVTVLAFGAVNEHFASDLSDVERIAALRRRTGLFRQRWESAVQQWRSAQALAYLVEQARGGREQILERWREKLEQDGELQQGFERADYSGPRRVPLELFETELLGLLAEVRAGGSLPVILRMPRRSDATNSRSALGLYDDALERIAVQAGVLFVDASDVVAPAEEGDLFFDPYHPKPEGHRRIGVRVAEALAGALRDSPPAAVSR